MTPFSLLVAALFLPGIATSEEEQLRSGVVVDLALEFNAACIRILHSSTREKDKRQSFELLKAIMRGGREGTSKSFFSTASTTFLNFLKQGNKIRGTQETCYKPLEVIIANEDTKKEFKNLCNHIRISNSKWIIFTTGNHTEYTFLEEANIPFDSQVLTATYTLGGFSIRENFRINRTSPLRVVYLGMWTRRNGLLFTGLESFYERRGDLNGVVFRTGSIQNWPVSAFIKNSKGEKVIDGFFPRVWNELEHLLNVSSINLSSDDNSTGDISSSGEWNGLVGMLERKEIDIIVSELNMNEERTVLIDFTHPLLQTRYQIYFRVTSYDLAWTAVFKPFDPDIWLALSTWILVGAVALSLCYLSCRPFQPPSDLSLRPYYTIFFMLQTMCQQGYSQVPTSVACRTIFMVAYILSAVIIPSYSASLVSSLTAPSPNKPYDSLQEMLDYGKENLLVPEHTAEYAHFSKSKNHLYLDVFEKLVKTGTITVKNSVEGASKVCQNQIALFGVESSMDLKMEEMRLKGCETAKFTQALSMVSQSMGLLKGNPYTGVIDYHLANMFASGVIDRIRRTVWPLKPSKHESSYKQVTFATSGVFQVFTCLGCGIVLSVALLCLEILFARRKRETPSATPKFNAALFYNDPGYLL